MPPKTHEGKKDKEKISQEIMNKYQQKKTYLA